MVPRRKAGGNARQRQLKRLPTAWRPDVLPVMNAYVLAVRAGLRPPRLHRVVAAALRKTQIPFRSMVVLGRHPAEPYAVAIDALLRAIAEPRRTESHIEHGLADVDGAVRTEWELHGEPDVSRTGSRLFAFAANSSAAKRLLFEFIAVDSRWKQALRLCAHSKCPGPPKTSGPLFLQRSARQQRFCSDSCRQAAFRNE